MTIQSRLIPAIALTLTSTILYQAEARFTEMLNRFTRLVVSMSMADYILDTVATKSLLERGISHISMSINRYITLPGTSIEISPLLSTMFILLGFFEPTRLKREGYSDEEAKTAEPEMLWKHLGASVMTGLALGSIKKFTPVFNSVSYMRLITIVALGIISGGCMTLSDSRRNDLTNLSFLNKIRYFVVNYGFGALMAFGLNGAIRNSRTS